MELVMKRTALVGGYGVVAQGRGTKVTVSNVAEAKELVRQGFAEEYDEKKHKNAKTATPVAQSVVDETNPAPVSGVAEKKGR